MIRQTAAALTYLRQKKNWKKTKKIVKNTLIGETFADALNFKPIRNNLSCEKTDQNPNRESLSNQYLKTFEDS